MKDVRAKIRQAMHRWFITFRKFLTLFVLEKVLGKCVGLEVEFVFFSLNVMVGVVVNVCLYVL